MNPNALNPVTKIIWVRTLQLSALGTLAHFLLHWPFTGPFALGFFLTPLLCVYFVFVFVGPLTWGLPILSRLPDCQNTVALTFDDGPSEITPCVLDILRTESISATFFVLGEAVNSHPDILCRIAAEGHAIGIHGNTHYPFVLQSVSAIRREIQQTKAAIVRACPNAKIVRWVRPPHGFKSLTLAWTLHRFGYGFAAWSVNSRDYQERDPAQIAARVCTEASAGAVILLHDGPANASTAEALPLLLRGLAEKNLAAVPLPDWGKED